MIRRLAQLRTAILLGTDACAAAAALGTAYGLRFGAGLLAVHGPHRPARYLEALLPSVALALLAFALTGRYRAPADAADPAPARGGETAAVLAAVLLLAAGTLFYRDEVQFSRGLLLLFLPVGIPFLRLSRALAERILAALRRRGVGVRRALLVGEGPRARALARVLADRTRSGVDVAGTVPGWEGLSSSLAALHPDQVFVALPASRHEELGRILETLSGEMVDVRVVPDLGAATLLPETSLLGGMPVFTLQQTPFYGIRRLLKRAFDLLLSAVLLVLLSPLLLLTALLVLVTSGRPVLYRQERMGLDGRRFTILKFRTMKVGAEEGTGAVWAVRGDPRCTRLGRLLRRLSLDELPQLVNVLRGEMSLVGPRPERPVLVERFRRSVPRYMLRHRIPAGLTGWAQIHGLRGESDLEARIRYDLAYLERWSLLLDVEILLRTVWQVFRGENAV